MVGLIIAAQQEVVGTCRRAHVPRPAKHRRDGAHTRAITPPVASGGLDAPLTGVVHRPKSLLAAGKQVAREFAIEAQMAPIGPRITAGLLVRRALVRLPTCVTHGPPRLVLTATLGRRLSRADIPRLESRPRAAIRLSSA